MFFFFVTHLLDTITDNSTLYGDTYMRQCESMTFVQKKVIKLFELHGTKDAAVEIASCNYDGSYGLYTVQKNE